jgi:glycosyltransferase involved in cell wall biosynthesis
MIGQLGRGGTEKQVVLLADGLRRRGVDARVLVMFAGGPRTSELRAAGVPVVDLGFHRRPARPAMIWGNLAAFVRLVRYLRRVRPVVLHAFLFHSYVTASPAARLARVPVVVAGRRSMAVTRGRPLFRAVERVANLMTDLLVANAEAVAEDARHVEGVPAGKITVVYNALPEDAFVPAPPARIAATSPVVLCVANLRPGKGHADLLDAAALLRERGTEVTLVLAGDGPRRPELAHRAGTLGLDVRFLGSRTDVNRLLARADVVALPSTAEGLSNAVMEAMAAGRPVVATRVGGTVELLSGRGVLVPPGDPAALADGLHAVLTVPGYAETLVAAAREWIVRAARIDAMVDRHVEIYGELWSRRCAA